MAPTGSISWMDLTVPDAAKFREFYSEVVGWRAQPVSMGGYDDFTMIRPSDSEAVRRTLRRSPESCGPDSFGVAGVCHARGVNANLPVHGLVCITVENLDDSVARRKELGGKVIVGPRTYCGEGRFCMIEDLRFAESRSPRSARENGPAESSTVAPAPAPHDEVKLLTPARLMRTAVSSS